MAYEGSLRGENSLAYTIHVWPSSELVAQSWAWPERWREAYELVAGVIGRAVVLQILDGGALPEGDLEMPSELGRVSFTISQVGTTIHIVICEFTGPDRPGPNGGARQQPTPIDGLVLGLRGSNGCSHVVVFHGTLPPFPADYVLPSSTHKYIPANVDHANFVARLDQILSALSYFERTRELVWDEFVFDYADNGCTDAPENAEERTNLSANYGEPRTTRFFLTLGGG